MESVHAAKIFLPEHFAIQIQTIEAARTEKDVKPFTIADGRIGSEAARFVTALVRPLFAQDLLPRNFPISSVDGDSQKLVAMRDRHAVVNAGGVVENWFLLRASGHCGEDIHPIAEDNRRRM